MLFINSSNDVCFLSQGMAELDAVHIKTKLYIPIILPFLMLFCLIRDLGSLTWLSWFANIIMVIVLISIYQYLYGHVQRPSELEKFSSWGDLPLFFGATTYAFEAIPIVSIRYNFTYLKFVSSRQPGIKSVMFSLASLHV